MITQINRKLGGPVRTVADTGPRTDGGLAKAGSAPNSGRNYAPDIHPMVFVSLFSCFAAIMAAFLILFWGRVDAIFMVVVSAGYLLIYAGLPMVMLRSTSARHPAFAQFLRARVRVFEGTLSGRDAWIQICLIPFMLMLATFGICVVVASLRP